MISVAARFENDRLTSLITSGHASFAPKNNDIVCASCSVLLRTVARYFEKIDVIDNYQIKDGFVSLALKNNDNPEVDTITKLLILGLNDLENEFPAFFKLIIERK